MDLGEFPSLDYYDQLPIEYWAKDAEEKLRRLKDKLLKDIEEFEGKLKVGMDINPFTGKPIETVPEFYYELYKKYPRRMLRSQIGKIYKKEEERIKTLLETRKRMLEEVEERLKEFEREQ